MVDLKSSTCSERLMGVFIGLQIRPHAGHHIQICVTQALFHFHPVFRMMLGSKVLNKEDIRYHGPARNPP